MKRAGGYSTYDTAYNRILLAESRPLDSADAGLLPPGTHLVRVVEVEWNWGWIRLTLQGRAHRRVTTEKIWCGDHKWRKLGHLAVGLTPGQLSAARTRLLGVELQIRCAEFGDVDLRICSDGQILGVDRRGHTEVYPDIAAAEAHLVELGLRRRRPGVADIYSVRAPDNREAI